MKKAFTMIELIFVIILLSTIVLTIVSKKDISDITEKDVRTFITKVATKSEPTPKIAIEYVKLQKKYQALQVKHIALQNHAMKDANELIDCRSELNQKSINDFDVTTGTGY